jgi:hypothetical protein
MMLVPAQEGKMQKLYYIENNAFVPVGVVSSSARRGTKWDGLVKVGDRVALTITETGEKFGEAVIVHKEVVRYVDVLDNAATNHVAFNLETAGKAAGDELEATLCAAYGHDIAWDEAFTVLHLVVINRDEEDDDAVKQRKDKLVSNLAVAHALKCISENVPDLSAVEYFLSTGDITEGTRYEF